MAIYLIAVITALVLSLILTPVAKVLAFRFGLLDKPGFRKIHEKPNCSSAKCQRRSAACF